MSRDAVAIRTWGESLGSIGEFVSLHAPQPLTSLLSAAARGDREAEQQLWAVVYAELHRMAGAILAGDGVRQGLHATTLVHEAYLRLVGPTDADWNSRCHFYSAAAIAMRRICVDYARKRDAKMRGGGRPPVRLPAADDLAARSPAGWPAEGASADMESYDLEILETALKRLEALDPRKARIIDLRYFAGLTGEETAKCLSISARTVDSECRFARAWLHREMTR